MKSAFFAVLLLSAHRVSALQTRAGTATAEFLRIGAGARALGMGEAFSAVAEGSEAAYWNPAGLARLDRPEMSYARAEFPRGLHHDFASVGAPVPVLGGTLALAFTRLSSEKIEMVDASNQNRGFFAPHSEVLAVAYGRDWAAEGPDVFRDDFHETWNVPGASDSFVERRGGEVAGGLAVKLVRQDLGTRSAETVAFDVGSFLRREAAPEWIIAGAFRHLGGRLKFISESEPLPGELAAAVAYDLREEDWRLLPSVELDVPYAGQVCGKFGAEFSALVARNSWASLRLGYDSRSVPDLGALSGLTAGVGVRTRGFSFDAAVRTMGALGESLRIAASWRF